MHGTTVKIKKKILAKLLSSFGSHLLIIVSGGDRRLTQFWTIHIQSKHVLFSTFNTQFYSHL
jgi:hypothetical protein